MFACALIQYVAVRCVLCANPRIRVGEREVYGGRACARVAVGYQIPGPSIRHFAPDINGRMMHMDCMQGCAIVSDKFKHIDAFLVE